MKKLLLLIAIVIQGITATQAQAQELDFKKELEKDTVQKVAIVEATVSNDYKLKVATEKVSQLIAVMERIMSAEKLQTDTIVNKDATKLFLSEILTSFTKFQSAFVQNKTINVDPKQITTKLNELETWKQKVESDTEIKDISTLPEYQRKIKELEKYQQIDNALKQVK